MINQVNLNTANAFTTSIQDKNTTSEIPISNNPLSIPEENIDTFDLQSNEKVDENKKEKKKPMPVWLKAILACVGTMAAVLGTGYVTTKLGYTPFKTDTKGLLNSRTTEFEKGAKAAVGEITSVMTLNSHCAQKSLEKLPTTHQGLIVVLDSQGAKGVKTLESKFKDKIIYGGELKLSELKNYGKLNEYVQKIAEKIKGKENYANITFASENTRCANMLNAVLRAHGEDKTAQTYDFVEGGIPSHYFWGSKGLNSEELDKAIWDGWCEGLEIQPEAPQQEAPEPQPGAQPQQGAGTTAQTGTGIPEQTGDNGSGSSVPVKQSDDDKTEETEPTFVSKFATLFQTTEKGKKHGAFDCNVSKITTKEQFLKHLTKEARNALIRDITEFSSLSEESKSKSITATRNKKKIEICINSAADPSDNISTVTLTVGNKNNEIKFSFSLKDLIEASIQKYNNNKKNNK